MGVQAWAVTETTIHTFAGGAYSEYPNGGLVFDSSGNAYGTASSGGAGYGTIYELTPSQSGWTANILYEFDNVSGASPSGPLVFDAAGNLYGAASYGGKMSGICKGSGCGTVFELQRAGGGWQFVLLYSFRGGADGSHPNPTLIFDKSGNLYGTTFNGGNSGYGTAFELSPSKGRWKESTVYAFAGNNDAAGPAGGLTAGSAGVFYGTTEFGGANQCGANNCGAVYKLHKTRSGWQETILHSFNGSDGSSPMGGSLLLRHGTLYGTTNSGGAINQGTAFSLTLTNHVETVLCSFIGTNGSSAYGGLVPDSAGNLYGITVTGGTYGYGTIFVLQNSNGTWQESVVHDFAGTADGSHPIGTPTFNAGSLFGTTNGGGEWDAGVAWEITWP